MAKVLPVIFFQTIEKKLFSADVDAVVDDMEWRVDVGWNDKSLSTSQTNY